MTSSPLPGSPYSDAQRELLERTLDRYIDDFRDLEVSYNQHLPALMNEAQRRLVNDPFFDFYSYILNDLSNWTAVLNMKANPIKINAEILGIDCIDVWHQTIEGHKVLVAKLEENRSTAQAQEHKDVFEMQMEKLKLQAEMMERHRQRFWDN